mgnify:CR=1 FL=1
MDKDSQLYEIGYILKADDEKSAEDFSDSLKEAVVSNHGIVIAGNNPKMRHYAYPINKRRSGYFGWIKFLLNTELLGEIKKYLEKQEIISRFLLIKLARETLQEPRKERVPKKIVPEEKKVDIEEIDKKLEEILG